MAQPVARPGIPDGYRDRLRGLAELADEGASDMSDALHDRINPTQAILHAGIDARHRFERLADELRRLRR